MNFESEVNSYEDICKILNINPDLKPDVSAYDEEDQKAAVSLFRLWNANKAAWNGEMIDFNNNDQAKYEILYDLGDEVDPDSGFMYFTYRFVSNSTHVGARLLWPSITIAKHMTKVMQKDFVNVMKIPENNKNESSKLRVISFKSEINSYEDICKILNIEPDLTPDISAYVEEHREAAISMFRLWKANKVAWNGETIDFNNYNPNVYQNKYEVMCNLSDEAGGGSGFVYFSCSNAGGYSAVGARFLWPSTTTAKHMTKVMREDFINVMKIPKTN
ncbi:hypothetical protein QFZ37_002758 [Chryseobacterium ginsenosidimutans]|uniref:hypothetical protein n=1 Tax=Chryseobacterium ginsenosidimutans TaxID=687846 RepID=UPI002785DA4F|nr:hypothetical protein [Chryseobacterium ginsenosidimutans]MDQ0594389.1 hypothetical protein [Chryseobacterium ginsenosidimutans]